MKNLNKILTLTFLSLIFMSYASVGLGLSGQYNVNYWTSTLGNNNLEFNIDSAQGISVRVQSRELKDISAFTCINTGDPNLKIFDGYVSYEFYVEILTDKDENTGLNFNEITEKVQYAKIESGTDIHHWTIDTRKVEYFYAYYNHLQLVENLMTGYDSDILGNVFLNPTLRDDFIVDRDYGNLSVTISNKEFVSAPTGVVVLESEQIDSDIYNTYTTGVGNSQEVAISVTDIGVHKDNIDPDGYGDANIPASFFDALGLKKDTNVYYADLPAGQYRQTYQQGHYYMHGVGTDDILQNGMRIINIPDIRFIYEPLTLTYQRIVIDTAGLGTGIHQYTESQVSTPILDRVIACETNQKIQRYKMSVQFHLNSLCELGLRDEDGKPIAEYSLTELADMYRTSLVSNEKAMMIVNSDTWIEKLLGFLDEFKGLIFSLIGIVAVVLILFTSGGTILKGTKSLIKSSANKFERKAKESEEKSKTKTEKRKREVK